MKIQSEENSPRQIPANASLKKQLGTKVGVSPRIIPAKIRGSLALAMRQDRDVAKAVIKQEEREGKEWKEGFHSKKRKIAS